MFICLFVCLLFIYLFICLLICLFVCLFVYLFVVTPNSLIYYVQAKGFNFDFKLTNQIAYSVPHLVNSLASIAPVSPQFP